MAVQTLALVIGSVGHGLASRQWHQVREVGFGIYPVWGKAMNKASQREKEPCPPPYRAGHHSGAHGPYGSRVHRSRAKIAGLIR